MKIDAPGSGGAKALLIYSSGLLHLHARTQGGKPSQRPDYLTEGTRTERPLLYAGRRGRVAVKAMVIPG